ncbi:MAG: hypothetical protein ACOYN4_10795 [Bacteroidales bacterium]
MTNNSNQTGTLLLLIIVLGIAGYAFMFFGSEMEQTNMSASFGALSKTKSIGLLSLNSGSADLKSDEFRSDLSNVKLPISKPNIASGAQSGSSTNVDLIPTNAMQTGVQSMNNSNAITSTSSRVSYGNNGSLPILIGNATANNNANAQNASKVNIGGLIQPDLQTNTPAPTEKTANTNTKSTSNDRQKMGGAGGPSEPGGGSLPVGNGVWILLSLAGVYSVSRFMFRIPC